MANKLMESIQRTAAEAQKRGIFVTADDLVKIVKTHAAGAAASTMAIGALPGVGSTIASVIETSFVWSMYYRLCKKMGLNVKKELLKSLGSAVVTNIAASVAASLIAGTVLSIVPGIGTMGAVAVLGLMGYSVTYYSGFLFMELLFRLFKAGKSVEQYSAEEIKSILKEAGNKTSFKELRQEAKEAFKHRKEDGVATPIEDDDPAVPVIPQKPEHLYWLHTGIDFGSTNSVMAWQLYKWTDEEGWQLDTLNNKQNNIVRCPTVLVFKADNPAHPVVQAESETVIIGKRAEELANDNQEPAVARTNFKPQFYDLQEGTPEWDEAKELVRLFLGHLHQLYESEILHCLPNQVVEDMCSTIHLSTPVRAENTHRKWMKELAKEAGFPDDGVRHFIDTSRNEAECVMHLAVDANINNLQKLMQMSHAKAALNLLFIDVGGSTTDIELIKQEMHSAGKSTQVLAMWPKENVQYMLGGCEVDRAIFNYLVEEGCLIPRFANNCWEHGTGKTLFRKLKENNNDRLHADQPIASLGPIRAACGDPDEDEMPRCKYKDHLITKEVFENRICHQYIESLCSALHDVLRNKVDESEIDGVFLTGAGSRLYFIHDLILGRCGENPLALTQLQQDETRLFDQYNDPATCCAEGAISGVM